MALGAAVRRARLRRVQLVRNDAAIAHGAVEPFIERGLALVTGSLLMSPYLLDYDLAWLALPPQARSLGWKIHARCFSSSDAQP